MQRSRRTVLASLPVVLAGCSRRFRQNAVPGGLYIQNSRRRAVTVVVRAARRPPNRTAGDGGQTPTETPETPAAVESPDQTGEYEVGPGDERAVPNFFPEAGRWAVEAVVGDDSGNRVRIELYAAIPGPTGADTVRIQVSENGVDVRATTRD